MAFRSYIARKTWTILRHIGAGPLLLRVHPKSGLLRLGWFNSFRLKESVDRQSNPIPWWTYSAVSFIQERVNKQMNVLEFGCGSSTVWLCERVKRVVSLENCSDWIQEIGPRLPHNGEVIFYADLTEVPSLLPADALYDLVIVDNMGNRIDAAMLGIHRLSDAGVLLWDNTDGPDWEQIKAIMSGRGFRDISFTGLAAQEVGLSRTTIFYREQNCLCI